MVDQAWSQNPAGGGVAWREGNMVRWVKGLEREAMSKMCAELPLPYIAHFRIPSVGGKRDDLCHPFPVQKDVSLALEGKTKGSVLFHNGHWHQWKDAILTTVKFTGFKIPIGKWSDTRAMAWYAAHVGIGILEFIDEKAVIFSPEKCEIFGNVGTGGWCEIEGVWASNRFFTARAQRTNNGFMGGGTTSQNNVHGSFHGSQRPQSDFYHGQAPASIGPVQEKVVTPPVRQPGTGGSQKEDPFVIASRLYEAGRLSKKKWKKAKRAYEQRQRYLADSKQSTPLVES